MFYPVNFLLLCGTGFMAVWLAAGYGWHWGVLLVLLSATAVSYWQYSQSSRVWQWLQRRGTTPEPVVAGSYGSLVAAFSSLRRTLVARLGRSNRLLASIRRTANDLPIAVVTLGAAGHIYWANSSAGELLGVNWPDDAGVPLQHLCRNTRLRLALEQGQETVLEMSSTVRRDNWVRLHVLPHKKMTLVLGSDITESVRTRRLRRDFVSNASHELRTPLAVMSSITESMAEVMANPGSRLNLEQLRQPVALLRKKVLAMISLVEDMLSLSELESEQAANVASRGQENVDVAKLCQQLVDDLGQQPGGDLARLKLNMSLQAGLSGSGTELYTVLSNLVNNAVTYNDSEVEIVISWESAEGGGCLRVADNGIGIEARHIPHLSERFYRVDEYRHKSGTGLGLAIVRHILQRHDAVLRIESTPGQGSIFSCHFPGHRLTRS